LAIQIKNVTIEDVENSETKRVKQLRAVSKAHGFSLTMDLPEVLCSGFAPKQEITVLIDNSPISRGDGAQLYVQGRVFKVSTDTDKLEVVGTVGGLRTTMTISKPTPAKKRVFSEGVFYMALL